MSRKQESNAKHVGIWIRVSTEDQVKGESPEHHEKRARLYAEAKGWHVVEVYRLDAVSGKTVKETPEAKRMMEDIREGHITGLIFSKLARLARNTKELLEFSEYFREYSADLISLAEAIDTSTPAGRLFYTMIAAMAQWEREEISERVAASVPIRAKLGKPTGGAAPYGYQWKDKQLVIDPKEAPVRKFLFELFKQHGRKKVVARLLNEQGHRTRGGDRFSDTTVDRLLRDPIAKGLRRANYTKSTGDGKHWDKKPESEWVFSDVEAVVPEDLWNECNGILEAQRASKKPRAKPTLHLFSGFVYCACGTKMYVSADSPKYLCTKCRTKIPKDDLETIFHEQIKNFLFSTDEIAAHLEKANEAIKEKAELLPILEKERQKLAGEIDKLHDLYQSGEIDKKGFGARYRPMAERLEQLDDRIPTAQAELDVLRIGQLSEEEVLQDARDLYSRWPELPFDEKRRIVETITERIVIGKDEVEINLLYTPPPSPSSGGGSSSNRGGNSVPPSSNIAGGNRRNFATKPHSFVAFFRVGRIALKALKGKETDFEPKTVGDHVRKHRLQLGLTQKAVAKLLGVSQFSIIHWEKHGMTPPTTTMGRIIKFLGYDPLPTGQTISERLRQQRRMLGWGQRELAEHLGVDRCTVTEWELGGTILRRSHRTVVSRFLGLSDADLTREMAERWNKSHGKRSRCGQ